MSVDYKQELFKSNSNATIRDMKVKENDQWSKLKELKNDLYDHLDEKYELLIENIVLKKEKINKLESAINDWLLTQKSETLKGFEHEGLVKKLCEQIVGWGKIHELIERPDVTDIFTNEKLEVIKRISGEDIKTNMRFDSDEEIKEYIDAILLRNGKKIDNNECVADTMDHLYGVRINAAIYGDPIRKSVVRSPYITLRNFKGRKFQKEFFIKNGTFSDEIHQFFEEVILYSNMLIIGESGAGKTTLLEYIMHLKKKLEPMRRTIIIQEEDELKIQLENSVSFTVRKNSGKDDARIPYEMAEFAKIATRLAGKEVIIGETRGAEAWFLLRLLMMGYFATTTAHAGSIEEGIEMIAFLCYLADINIPYELLVKKICRSFNFVIYVSNKKIIDIAEITGYNDEKKEVEYKHLFQLDIDDDGNFKWNKNDISETFRKKLRLQRKLAERRV